MPRYEHLYIQAINHWLEGNFTLASSTYESIVDLHPSDLFACKRAQLMAFLDGDKDRLLSIVSNPVVMAVNRERPYFQGMRGFALEQNGFLNEAEEAGREGTRILPSDAWSHHAVAHSLYFQCRLSEGVTFMVENEKHWRDCCSFMLTHNWWHIGLFYLDMGLLGEVERLFDSKIWAVDKYAVIFSSYATLLYILISLSLSYTHHLQI